MIIPLTLPLLIRLSLVRARSVNVTIDDSFGDKQRTNFPIHYSPSDAWVPGLTAGFDGAELYSGNCAMNIAHVGNMTLTFNGTRVYLFYAILGGKERLRFYLDVPAPAPLPWAAPSPPIQSQGFAFSYNNLLFESEQLSDHQHTLRVVSGPGQYCFDYAVYTINDVEPSETSIGVTTILTGTTGKITSTARVTGHRHSRFDVKAVFAATAVAAAACLAAGAWFCIRRCGRPPGTDGSSLPAPFLAQPSAVPGDREKALLDWTRKATAAPPASQASQAARRLESTGGNTQREANVAFGATTSQSPVPRATSPGMDDTGDILTALERVCAENERVRAENEAARSDIERLRQAVELPPPYAPSSRDT